MDKKLDFSIFPFFSNISAERLSELEAFSFTQTYDKGSVVFQKNEPAKYLYALIKGEIELSILFKEKIITKDIKHEEYINTHVEKFERPIAIELITEKGIFGWSSLVEPAIMSSTATCLSNSTVALIPAVELKTVFNKDNELGYIISSRINTLIATRLSSRTEKLVDSWCQLFEIADLEPAD